MPISVNSNSLSISSSIINHAFGTFIETTALTKAGNGTLLLSGANAYTGGTTLNAGLLLLGHDSALGTGTLTVNGGTLAAAGAVNRSLLNAVTLNGDLTFGAAAVNTGSLTISGAVSLGGVARVLTVNLPDSGRATLSGVVGGTAGFVKAGPGTLMLTGSNTFTGNISVVEGMLGIVGTGSDPLSLGAAVLEPSPSPAAAFRSSEELTIRPRRPSLWWLEPVGPYSTSRREPACSWMTRINSPAAATW